MNRAEIVWMLSTDESDESDPLEWLAELTRRPPWHARAACRGMEPATFVLGRGANAATMDRAKAICSGCPVSEPCLDFAMADPDTTGIWGGTTGRQRKLMRAGKVA